MRDPLFAACAQWAGSSKQHDIINWLSAGNKKIIDRERTFAVFFRLY